MRALAISAALAALAVPAGAVAMDMGGDAAPGAHVSVLFGSVTPTRVDVLVGESVHWSNDSVRNHTITADDGSYDSGNLSPNSDFMRTFTASGTYRYYCRLHPYIRGEVDVERLLVERPTQPASAARAYPLSGRAALPSGSAVEIQADAGNGSGWRRVADATTGADGHFTALVEHPVSGSYRAVAGGETSPAVALVVLDRTVTAASRGNHVRVRVAPAAPGATVVLQLYLKERFGWWPVAKRKLDKGSRATFKLGRHRRVSARVLLTLPDGATELARSKRLILRSAR